LLSGYDNTTIVTLVGVPENLSPANPLASFKNYGKVLQFRDRAYRDKYSKVLNGKKQYRMIIENPDSSNLKFGGVYVMVCYSGQVRTSLQCGVAAHLAQKCTSIRCNNPLSLGLTARECVEKCTCN